MVHFESFWAVFIPLLRNYFLSRNFWAAQKFLLRIIFRAPLSSSLSIEADPWSKSWSQSTDETFSLKPLSYHHRLSQGFVTSFRQMLPNVWLESDELEPNPKFKFILGSNTWENGSLDSQSSCEKWNIVIFLLTKRLIMWISAEVDFECIPRSK